MGGRCTGETLSRGQHGRQLRHASGMGGVAEFLAAIVGPLDQAEIQGFPERTMGGTCHRETLQFAATKRGVVTADGNPLGGAPPTAGENRGVRREWRL